MIKDKEISRCGIVSCGQDNEFASSFTYDDKQRYTKRDSLLLARTNVYLKLNDKYYPVITEINDVFSDILRTEGWYMDEFNFCYVTVNAKGEILKYFAY